MKPTSIAFLVVCCASFSFACLAPDDAETREEELGETVSSPIVNGTAATSIPEAALIDTATFVCSGAVVAPRVVLTAGHCIVGASSWSVKTPFAGNQRASGTRAWTDYTSTGEFVNPNTLDVGVIILDKAISLSTYPTLASAVQPSGTQAYNVGRIRNGVTSFTQLYQGATVTLQSGASWGFPKSYRTAEIIESGDSGGPVYVGTGATRTLVAVNSGGGGGTQVLARVDLAFAKIQELIAANGGSGSSSSSSGGSSTSSSGGSSTSSSGGSSSGTTPTCVGGSNEVEPNDASGAAKPLGAKVCGALATGLDVDWYAWSIGAAGITYDVGLAASGDADILMWKSTGGGWTQISNTTATRISATSGSAGNYLVAVRSSGNAAQSYTLTLKK